MGNLVEAHPHSYPGLFFIGVSWVKAVSIDNPSQMVQGPQWHV